MGTEYYVACRQCKVRRDLDKFWAMTMPVSDRQAALDMARKLEGNAFRAALLTSFMWEHKLHDCFVFSEHDADRYFDEFEEESTNYFQTTNQPKGFTE